MKIWIDDVRPAPDGYIWKKSVNEAIKQIEYCVDVYSTELAKEEPDETVLESYRIELISLDHDAGNYEKDGGDYIKILDYAVEHKEAFDKMNTTFRIHSMNPVGRQNMQRIIERNGWKLIW